MPAKAELNAFFDRRVHGAGAGARFAAAFGGAVRTADAGEIACCADAVPERHAVDTSWKGWSGRVGCQMHRAGRCLWEQIVF